MTDTDETPLAWSAILADTPVYSSDDVHVGNVHEVLGAEDIFHGLVVRAGLGHDRMIPADQVGRITDRRIDTALTADQVRSLPAFVPEESFQLGIVGLFRRHLGWVPGGENDHRGES